MPLICLAGSNVGEVKAFSKKTGIAGENQERFTVWHSREKKARQ
jgi:hypothetical protein